MRRALYSILALGCGFMAVATAPEALADQATLNHSLRQSARQGLLQDVQKLLAEGAEANTQAAYGQTPLLYAAMHGHTEVVKELLSQGAEPDRADYNGNTPLIMAAMNCSHRAIKVLLKAGVDVNRENQHGSTALTLAADQGCAKVIELLVTVRSLKAGHRDDWDKSAIDYAREGLIVMGDPYFKVIEKLGPRVRKVVSSKPIPLR